MGPAMQAHRSPAMVGGGGAGAVGPPSPATVPVRRRCEGTAMGPSRSTSAPATASGPSPSVSSSSPPTLTTHLPPRLGSPSSSVACLFPLALPRICICLCWKQSPGFHSVAGEFLRGRSRLLLLLQGCRFPMRSRR